MSILKGFFDFNKKPIPFTINPDKLGELEKLFVKSGFNPGKIRNVDYIFLNVPCQLVEVYTCGLRRNEAMCVSVKGLDQWVERPELTTTDGYHWLGGMLYQIADVYIWVLFPRMQSGNLDRHISFFASHPIVAYSQHKFEDRILHTFKKLSEDRWYDSVLHQINAGAKKKIVFSVKRGGDGSEIPARRVLKKVRLVTGKTARYLGIGIQNDDVNTFLVLGHESDLSLLQSTGFEASIY